jgi:hypothetical protein
MVDEKEEKPVFFYLAIDDIERGGNGFLVYATEKFKLTEFDIINIIKTLVVDRRGSVNAGRKIMRVYQDATGYSQKAIEKLKQIGVEIDEEDEPTRTRKTKTI